MPGCMQVSLAAYGSACAGRPAAALDAVRNFTAAAALQSQASAQPGLQQGPAGVLAGYAAAAAEQFERAKRVCKKVRALSCVPWNLKAWLLTSACSICDPAGLTCSSAEHANMLRTQVRRARLNTTSSCCAVLI